MSVLWCMYTVKIKIFVEVGDSPTIRPNNLDVLLLVFVFLACIPSVVVTVVVYSSYFADQYVCVCVCVQLSTLGKMMKYLKRCVDMIFPCLFFFCVIGC